MRNFRAVNILDSFLMHAFRGQSVHFTLFFVFMFVYQGLASACCLQLATSYTLLIQSSACTSIYIWAMPLPTPCYKLLVAHFRCTWFSQALPVGLIHTGYPADNSNKSSCVCHDKLAKNWGPELCRQLQVSSRQNFRFRSPHSCACMHEQVLHQPNRPADQRHAAHNFCESIKVSCLTFMYPQHFISAEDIHVYPVTSSEQPENALVCVYVCAYVYLCIYT
jgi:hypothetical protein